MKKADKAILHLIKIIPDIIDIPLIGEMYYTGVNKLLTRITGIEYGDYSGLLTNRLTEISCAFQQTGRVFFMVFFYFLFENFLILSFRKTILYLNQRCRKLLKHRWRLTIIVSGIYFLFNLKTVILPVILFVFCVIFPHSARTFCAFLRVCKCSKWYSYQNI